jgi:elongation factor P
MKINGNAIRPGNVIEHQDRVWRAVKIQHTQPGKGGAYLQVELKDLRSGTKLNERFRSSETVERLSLAQKEHQFLFADGDMYTFMDNETYDQFTVSVDAIGEDQIPYLQDGMTVIVEAIEDEPENPIGIALPDHVTLEVVEADAVVKGQTASSSFKPALLDNGVRTAVPPFIEAGTRVVIATADGSYVERAKD